MSGGRSARYRTAASDLAGEHRWRFGHRNGTVLARASEGYASRSNAIENINSVKRNLPHAPESGESSDGEESETE